MAGMRPGNTTEGCQGSGRQGRLIRGNSVLQVLFIAAKCGLVFFFF